MVAFTTSANLLWLEYEEQRRDAFDRWLFWWPNGGTVPRHLARNTKPHFGTLIFCCDAIKRCQSKEMLNRRQNVIQQESESFKRS
jgi:hypothetical protein